MDALISFRGWFSLLMHFRINYSVNKQNVMIKGTELPSESNPIFLNSLCVVIWCDVPKD